MDTKKINQKSSPMSKLIWKIAVVVAVVVVCVVGASALQLKAAGPSLEVREINYENSTITLYSPYGDTTGYFSDNSKKTWDIIPGGFAADGTITLNISWVSTTTNYTINFKGDKSTEILTVKLPKQASNFKASFQMAKGTMSFSNVAGRTIEWRKLGSSVWKEVNTDTIATELEYLYNNGATVYFRLAPVNGDKNSVGMRPSKEVSVKIKQKSAAPSVLINGSTFTIDSASGLVYRYVAENGSVSEWETPNSSALRLSDIAPSVLYGSQAQKEVTLQFRKKATATTQVSAVATVIVPVQEAAPNVDTAGITMTYTSASTLELTVKAASTTAPYEYTTVEEDEIFDLSSASWTAITSDSPVSINKEKVPEGSRIYIRKKSTGTGDEFKLASAELNLTGDSGVDYPDATEVEQLTRLSAVAGVCNTNNTESDLSFTLYSAYRTTVSSMKFHDVYGNTKGSVSCKSTVARNQSATGSADAYIITTRIVSTEAIDSVTEQLLYADITLANSDVIESTSEAGVQLYLYPASKVSIPDEDGYTDSFERILASTERADLDSFSFTVEFGTQTLSQPGNYESLSNTPVEIASLEYDGHTLTKDTDYTVNYELVYDETSSELVRTADVTVNVKSFEGDVETEHLNEKLPVKITLNNGEILAEDIYITLIQTAQLREQPIAWSILEGSLQETKVVTITNTDGSSTTETVAVTSYELTLDIYDKNYNVGVSDVTWGGQSILQSAVAADGVIKIQLSNPKINKLTTDSTTTNDLIFSLSNGYVIETGCKLTILNAGN